MSIGGSVCSRASRTPTDFRNQQSDSFNIPAWHVIFGHVQRKKPLHVYSQAPKELPAS